MTAKQRKQRRLLRSLFWLAGGGIFLAGFLPLWFPWVLTPVAKRYGLQFAEYDRIGWTRFALTEVRGNWNGTKLEARRIESGLPTVWLGHRLRPHTSNLSLLSLSNGQLVIVEPAASKSNGTPGSAGGTLNQIADLGRTLRTWLPVAELTNCAVVVASHRVIISQAHWRAGQLQAVVQPPGLQEDVELVARFGGDSVLELSANSEKYEASLRTKFARTVEGWNSTGELDWLTNHASLSAQFTTNSWWPALAQVDFQHWQIPATRLNVDGYEHLTASATANFVSNRFDLQASGVAQPTDAAAQRGFPVVTFALGAEGDARGLNLQTLNIQSPFLNAELTNTMGITWAGKLQGQPAQLRITADLAKLPGTTLTGKVGGMVRVESREGQSFVQFQFATGPVNNGGLDAKSVLLRGEFAAPLLKLDEARVDFADGSVVNVNGAFDIATEQIKAARWQITGALLSKWLPGFSYAGLAASGAVDGPLTNLTHRGEVAIAAARTAGLKPFDFKAAWSGQQQHLSAANIAVTAGESVLSLGATADLDVTERAVAATVNQLSLRRGTEELYALQQPCGIKYRFGNANTSEPEWTLGVTSFNWQNQRHSMAADADLAWPARGNATLRLTNIAFADFADFIAGDIANFALAELAVAARWSNGPVQSKISLTGSMTNSPDHAITLHVSAKTEAALTIEQLTLANDYTPTLSVTGNLPVQILPARGAGIIVWDQARSIAVAGDWRSDQAEPLAIPLGRAGKLEIARPEFHVRIAGTRDQPAAELSLGAKTLAWFSGTTNSPLPKMEDLELELTVRPELIQLKTLAAKVDGQPLTATGEWPFTETDWRQLWSERKLPDWNQARGRLELDEAQLAAFAAYLPEMLSPEGRLSAALELKPGKHLAGVLSLTNAATRPMDMITPLRDIAASVRFNGTRGELEYFRGQIGGQPVQADGFASVANLDGAGLSYQINLRGTNVPLSRSAELLLRGDFDLMFRGGSNLPPQISGLVTLRDGLLVQNFSALVWSGPVRPEWRPPYFSVTNEPFADWKLDLALRGDRFLRVRTPVFSGILSADFQLRGSLKSPVLTGDARVNSGRLIFPFGSLTLNQGFASFNGNDLRGPELQINASGRNYRYEVRLEVKGPADGANILLSSTPPLAAEQILLMLTAGEVPQSDYAFSNSARAGRLGTFLGTDLLNRYLGTDPAKERLIFRSGESISGEGRLTYSVEYLLTDRWSIIGAYDEFNAFNVDLKWKAFTR